MEVYDGLVEWSGRGLLLLVNHLLEASFFFVLALLAVRALGRAPARARYTVWLLAGAKFLVPTALVLGLAARVGLPLPGFLTPGPAEGAGLLRAYDSTFVAAILTQGSLPLILAALWLGGAFILAGLWWWRHRRFARLVRAAAPVDLGRERQLLDRLRTRLGLARPVMLVISAQFEEPGVWGVARPVVVLPERMADRLTDPELEAVLLHELVHVARRDNLVSRLSAVLCCLFWFHPLVWWLDRQLLAERETACDDRVIELGSASRTYAQSLLKVLGFGVPARPAALSGAASANLRQRVERILSPRRASRTSWVQRLVLAATLTAVVLVSVAVGGTMEVRRSELARELWCYRAAAEPRPAALCPEGQGGGAAAEPPAACSRARTGVEKAREACPKDRKGEAPRST